MMKFACQAVALGVMVSATSLTMAEDNKLPFPGTITGNVNVVSSYNLRGMTNSPESDTPAVQGGLDYTHAIVVSIWVIGFQH